MLKRHSSPAALSWQPPGEGCKHPVRLEIVEPAAAGLVVVVEAVIKAGRHAFGQTAPDARLQGVLRLVQTQRQSGCPVVLSEIARRKRVGRG